MKWTPNLVLESRRNSSKNQMWYRVAFFEWKKEFFTKAKTKIIEETKARLRHLKGA